MNFTAPIFTKPVIAERRRVEFYCTDFHTDGKEIQNLQTEILCAMKPSMTVIAQILTKVVLNKLYNFSKALLSRISRKFKSRLVAHVALQTDMLSL